jgi:Flp pilus assembly pilin Flp
MKKRSWLYASRRQRYAGQGMVEYALLLGLIALAVVAIVAGLSGAVGNVFNQTKDDVAPNAPSDPRVIEQTTAEPIKTPVSQIYNTSSGSYAIASVPFFSDAFLN